MRALNDSDAFPTGSPELGGALGVPSSTRELLLRAEGWKPWSAYAAVLLMSAGSQNLVKSSTDTRHAIATWPWPAPD
jgi:3-methyladenine DNA glycosylase/8-oxoguanine DNA glycosylase